MGVAARESATFAPSGALVGRHLLADLHGIAPGHLTDEPLLRSTLARAVAAAGLTPVAPAVFHVFPGGGMTGFQLLAESHLALHTYPEHEYLALDAFTCGSKDPHLALAAFREALAPTRMRLHEVPRGMQP